MRVLVTGGAGFIGCWTVLELVRCGHSVVVVDSLEPQVHGSEAGLPDLLQNLVKSGSVEFVKGHVEDEAVLRPHLMQCQGVIHLAALVGVGQSTYESRRYALANTVSVSTIVELIVHGGTAVRKVVSASSISNYGEGAGWNPRTGCIVAPIRHHRDLLSRHWEPVDPADGLPVNCVPTNEHFPLRPNSIYGLTKRYTEDCIRLLGEATGIPVISLRYGNVYGPGQAISNPYTGILCIFYARMQGGNAPLIFEDGQQRRRFVHVRDVARANVLALESEITGADCINISSSEDTTLIDLVLAMSKGMGISVEPYILNVARVGDVRHLIPDVAQAQERIGFKAEISLEDGLNDWLQHMSRLKPLDRSLKALHELQSRSLLIGKLPPDLEI